MRIRASAQPQPTISVNDTTRMASTTLTTMSPATEKLAPPVAVPAVVPVARKFKASELPLPSATRSAIEGLAHSFKKKGGYDAIRKQVWEKFGASVCF